VLYPRFEVFFFLAIGKAALFQIDEFALLDASRAYQWLQLNPYVVLLLQFH
jgi:hypothetical protein